jgi:hypothetical protein
MNQNNTKFSVADENGHPLVADFERFEMAFAHLKKATLQQRDRVFWLHLCRPGQGWERILSSKDIA